MNVAQTTATLASIALVVFGATAPAHGARPQGSGVDRPAQQVLFMCPHGAAKSVLASAYFERLAKERGLNVRVQSAGTEPDATIAPAVAAHLQRQGYTTPTTAPRKATADDLAHADLVISLGCDLSGLPRPRGTLLQWNDIPSPSAEFDRADVAIRARVSALVDELVRQAAVAKP